MEGSDDVFVINSTAEEQAEEVPEARQLETAKETEAEAMESVKGLVPLCVQHLQGPQLSTATFGYDIAQMSKRPWAEPGAKLSDYFNYGFNEQSWRVYCALQKNGEEALLAKATEMLSKLEATGRPASATAAAGGEEAAGGGAHGPADAPVMAGDGGFHGGPYGAMPPQMGGGEMYGRGGFQNFGGHRPYPPRDFHGGGEPRPQSFNYKTRLCKAFAEGHCYRGDACNYAHGTEDLRQPGGGGPNAAPQQQQQQPQPQHQQGPNFPAPNFYGGGAAPLPLPERAANYLMPPGQGAGGPGGAGVGYVQPMMQPSMMAHDGDNGGGFRQPPKRQRQEGGSVYEPQY